MTTDTKNKFFLRRIVNIYQPLDFEQLNKNSKILFFENLYLLDVLIFDHTIFKAKNYLSYRDNKMFIFKKKTDNLQMNKYS
jgi:hypothetical protein